MKAILLMNLGSPDSTSVKDLRKYLSEFLMDERVIDYPYLLRLLLVRGIIVPFRSPKSAKAYRSIWTDEGSPLMVLTRQLQQALQQHVEEPVEIAMRYGNPTPKAAFDSLMKQVEGLDEVIAIPLYPHYAMSSYETAVEYAKEVYERKNILSSLPSSNLIIKMRNTSTHWPAVLPPFWSRIMIRFCSVTMVCLRGISAKGIPLVVIA